MSKQGLSRSEAFRRSFESGTPSIQSESLDEVTRARIRAEEWERAKVREEIAAEQRIQTRPSYWGGLFLNLLLSGAGLMFIGRVGLGFAWLLGTLALAFLTSPWLAWPIGAFGSLYHYDSLYGQLFATTEEKQREARAGRATPWLIFLVVLLIVGALILSGSLR